MGSPFPFWKKAEISDLEKNLFFTLLGPLPWVLPAGCLYRGQFILSKACFLPYTRDSYLHACWLHAFQNPEIPKWWWWGEGFHTVWMCAHLEVKPIWRFRKKIVVLKCVSFFNRALTEHIPVMQLHLDSRTSLVPFPVKNTSSLAIMWMATVTQNGVCVQCGF